MGGLLLKCLSDAEVEKLHEATLAAYRTDQ